MGAGEMDVNADWQRRATHRFARTSGVGVVNSPRPPPIESRQVAGLSGCGSRCCGLCTVVIVGVESEAPAIWPLGIVVYVVESFACSGWDRIGADSTWHL